MKGLGLGLRVERVKPGVKGLRGLGLKPLKVLLGGNLGFGTGVEG